MLDRPFDRDYRIRPGRYDRPGEQTHRLAEPYLQAGHRRTCAQFANDLERALGALEIGASDGEAIHR